MQIVINYYDLTKFPLIRMRFEYFINHKDGKKVRPLYAMLLKMSAHRRDFDEAKYVAFDKKMINY